MKCNRYHNMILNIQWELTGFTHFWSVEFLPCLRFKIPSDYQWTLYNYYSNMVIFSSISLPWFHLFSYKSTLEVTMTTIKLHWLSSRPVPHSPHLVWSTKIITLTSNINYTCHIWNKDPNENLFPVISRLFSITKRIKIILLLFKTATI